MSKCHYTRYVYNASAYGFAAQLERPAKQSIPTQAGSVLPASGGRGTSRVTDFKFDGIASVKDAYSEVGGSYDEDHDLYTTYAYSVLDGVNVADVLTADRVVARLTIYDDGSDNAEPRFDITGSHFENLKIAGQKVEVKLATDEFHKLQTYQEASAPSAQKWRAGSKLGELTEKALAELKHDYHGLAEMAGLIKPSKPKDGAAGRGIYILSPANNLELTDVSSEIKGYGCIIFVPKFGFITLSEMVVHRHSRTLTMFRVQMCSGSMGGADGSGTSGSGGMGSGGG